MKSRASHWTEEGPMAAHHWWHLTLF